jgi:hypothetical protein
MRARAAVSLFLVLTAVEAFAQAPATTERQPIGAREIERAQDQLAARRDFNATATKLRSARLREAIRDFQKNDYRVDPLHLTFGDYLTASGHYFVAMHFDAALPADATKATLFGLVDNGSGSEFWSLEEQVTLQRAPDGTAYHEQSFAFPPGNRNATFGFAVKGEPVAMASAPMLLPGIEKGARRVSRLLVSNQVFPLEKPPLADAPFAFGGIKVVPKGDRTFRRADEVWIFFEAQNPGVDANGTPNLATTVTLEGNGTTKKGLAGDAKAVPLKGVPGHYGVGATVDVSRLKPGEYTVRVSVADAIAQQQYELMEKIAIVE